MEVMVRLDPLRIALDLALVAVVLGGFVLNGLERLIHGDLTQLDDLLCHVRLVLNMFWSRILLEI